MARTNGPFGPPGAGAPLRRRPADDAFGGPAGGGQAPGQWPTQGFPDHGQAGQGYHFPPSEPDPNYGYNQQLVAHQQWGQQGDQRAYDLGNYPPVDQSYSDPGPFQRTSHHQQAYAEDADYRDEFFEDEEPRRGRRWIFIAAALVGAIGVGGALAYTYRSLIAPGPGRVPLAKTEPNVKVKPENRGAEKKFPNRVAETAPPKVEAEPQAQEEGEEKNLGPRKVPTIPIGRQPAQVPPPPMAVPGITLHGLQPPEPPPQAQPKAPQRVTIGERPPAPAEEPQPPPPAKKPPVVPQVVAKAPPAKLKEAVPPPASTGQGFVIVVASKKSSSEALKVYADLEQKFGDLLAGKTPAVQDSDQSARGLGMMYRLLVGPPGSREAAAGLCNQLKAAGQDCWVMAY